MDLEDQLKDPFSSDGLWKLSDFDLPSRQSLETLKLDGQFPSELRFGHWIKQG